MKTLEFKLSLTVTQSQTIDLWLEQLKWVWNRGLSLLEEDQQRRWRDKHGHLLPNSLKLKWKNGKLVGCGVYKNRQGYKCCDIRTNRDIEDVKKLFISSSYYNNTNAPEFIKNIPSKFRTGVHKSLMQAWKNYQDPKHPARRPQYKRKHDKLKSLANYNAGGKSKELKPVIVTEGKDNAYVSFPVLGKMKVKGFFDRFPQDCDYGRALILKEPSGYYLQVAVELPEKSLKDSDKAVGIDPGLLSVITTDHGREVKPPKLYRKQQKRLRRLQRQAARRQNGSGGQKRTLNKIARLHEKIRRSRNAFNHKLSTKLTREYSGIAVENIQLKNLTRKPKAKLREDGKGYKQNGAKRKAGLNKSFADSAIGDLFSKIESKCVTSGRELVRVPAAYTSINCSQCGSEIRKSLSTRTHRCTCGFVDSRDGNAGKNILLEGRKLFERESYRAWSWECAEAQKRDESVSSPTSGTTSNSETFSVMGMPPEVTQVTTSPEYGDQSRRGGKGVNLPSVPPDTSNLVSTILSSDLYNQPIRDSCSTSNPDILSKNSDESKKKKRTSAQINSENFVQLGLWDVAVETELESAG